MRVVQSLSRSGVLRFEGNRLSTHLNRRLSSTSTSSSEPTRTSVGTKKTSSIQPRVFSGIQPTGSVHLGNYLGAITYWKDLQQTFQQPIFSVVDLHSLTAIPRPDDPAAKKFAKELRDNIRETMIILIACGIDPKKSILYPQSMVSGHAELMWMLSSLTNVTHLTDMVQYKEKRKDRNEYASLGLLSYPILMTADILLYRATHVPVGEDQVPHLYLASDVAKTYNNTFSVNYFPQPKCIFGPARKVMSLTDGSVKMSKSKGTDGSRINLSDDADTILKKIRRAKTDTEKSIFYDPVNRPELANLLRIYSVLLKCTTGTKDELEDMTQLCQELSGKLGGASDFKTLLSELLIERLSPIGRRIKELRNHPEEIDKIALEGARRANEIAEQTITDVRQSLGLPPKF